MKRLALLVVLALSLASIGLSQSSDERTKRATEILRKSRKIDLLNDILPVLMDKKELNAILAALDKTKKNVEDEEQFEFSLISKLEGELDAAIKAGTEKGDMPTHALMLKLSKTFGLLAGSREEASSTNIKTVKDAMNKVLNAGQLKAAASTLDVGVYFPGKKPEEITQDQKLDMYVRMVLLDPEAYSLLTDLFKNAKTSTDSGGGS